MGFRKYKNKTRKNFLNMKNLIALLVFFQTFSVVYAQDSGDPDYDFYLESDRLRCKYYEDSHDYWCCRRYMKCIMIPVRDFNELIQLTKEKWFESDRIDYLKEAISHYYFTSTHAKKVLELLWFESSKLEIAKYIYPKILDKHRFHKVYEVFWFNSSIDELKEYIRRFPRKPD